MISLAELLEIASRCENLDTVLGLSCSERIGHSPYVIDKVLHRGDLTFTYKVLDTVNNRFFVVKEFFPQGTFYYDQNPIVLKRDGQMVTIKAGDTIAERDFSILKEQFKEDALIMKKLSQTNKLIDVIDVFQGNNTVYVVEPYIPYPNLSQLLKHKVLKPNLLIDIFLQILAAIKVLHQQGYVYNDLKPSKLYILDSGVLLSGFHLKLNIKKDALIQAYDNLFSAPESNQPDLLSPKSDVYALGKLLSYMMEHVGYKSNDSDQQMTFQYEMGRVDYVLSKTLESKPENRHITLDEIEEILKYKVKDKSKNGQAFKWVIAVLLLMVLTFIPLKWYIEKTLESDQMDFEGIQFSKAIYEISEDDALIKWETDDKGMQEIQLIFDSEVINISQKAHFIDLSQFNLKAGQYMLQVNNNSVEPQEVQVIVKAEENLLDLSFDFEWPYYCFKASEDKVISWENNELMSHLKIYAHQKLLYTMDIEQNSLDLSLLDLESGQYEIVVQLKNEHQVTDSKSLNVYISNDDQLKAPMIEVKNNQTLTFDDWIKWSPTDELVTIEWVGIENGFNYEKSYGDICQMKVSDCVTEPGLYHMYISSSNDNQMSEIVKVKVEILAK